MIFNVNSGAGKIPINALPDTNSSFTYDGEAKSPEWQNYDPEQLSIGGATSGTDAGDYTVYFTPKADYEWWDGTSTPKEVQWSIAKAAGSLSLSAKSATVTGKKSGAKTFTATRAGDGAISVSSSNTGIATASVSGTTVTVTPKGYGTATITVSVAEGTNHTAPSSKTYTITVDYLYLYKQGNTCTSVTGGYTTKMVAYGSDGPTTKAAKVTYNSTNMNMVQSDSSLNTSSVVVTVNAIDLTNYDTLYFDGFMKFYQYGNRASVGVWKSFGTYFSDNRAAVINGSTSSGVKSVSVSNLSGKYYVGFALYTNHNQSPNSEITMYNMYLG